MTTKTSFISIYIKDAHITCMRIQRPNIVRENHSLYGNAFEMTSHQQHLYECVQPLQGRITFKNPPDADQPPRQPYRNNFTMGTRDDGEKPDIQQWENLLLIGVLVLLILGCWLWSTFTSQYAINEVFLSQFVLVGGTSYKIQDAGSTKPVECLTIALFLIITSLVVGWQSNRERKTLPRLFSIGLVATIGITQLLAFIIHATMFTQGNAVLSLTNWAMILLHGVSFLLTLIIFVAFGFLGQVESENLRFETECNFWLCVVEDLNTIVSYALIYRACDSQVSIHDDTATFFDIVCIVLIGFMQHIANILMIFHAHIKLSGESKDIKTENINNIARTRTLLFFMIGVVTIFLYLRVAPTSTEYPAGVPFEVTRSLALIVFISLNSFHSFWFELQGSKTDVDWESSPVWKLMTTTCIAVASGIFLLQFVDSHRAYSDNASTTAMYKLLNPTTT